MEQAIGYFGLALCMIFCGLGSAYGLYKAGTAAAGVLSVFATKGKKWDEGDNQKAGYKDYRARKAEAERDEEKDSGEKD